MDSACMRFQLPTLRLSSRTSVPYSVLGLAPSKRAVRNRVLGMFHVCNCVQDRKTTLSPFSRFIGSTRWLGEGRERSPFAFPNDACLRELWLLDVF